MRYDHLPPGLLYLLTPDTIARMHRGDGRAAYAQERPAAPRFVPGLVLQVARLMEFFSRSHSGNPVRNEPTDNASVTLPPDN